MANASIEKSLYVGILKSRFDLWDDVKITTKSGDVIEGTIIEFEGEHTVIISTSETSCDISVDDIVKCEDV